MMMESSWRLSGLLGGLRESMAPGSAQRVRGAFDVRAERRRAMETDVGGDGGLKHA